MEIHKNINILDFFTYLKLYLKFTTVWKSNDLYNQDK